MMILVYGGSGSGKSAFAEEKIVEISKKNKDIYYVATMKVNDEEDAKRVLRHRKLREGKRFKTIEKTNDIGKLANEKINNSDSVMLECMSNLVANEMFTFDKEKNDVQILNKNDVFLKIKDDLEKIRSSSSNLLIVSNNVFDDGKAYDEYTTKYIETLGDINKYLADESDEVWEVVAGIPIRIK